MTPLTRLLATLVALTALLGCKEKTQTTIPLAWRNPAYGGGGFSELFIIGVGADETARRLFEDTFAKAIATKGAAAQASWGHLPQTEQLTEEQIRGAIDGGDFDGVLITRLLSVDEAEEYVPPTTHTVPSSYYGYGYYGYYGTSYAVVHEPGYYKTNTTFRLETNLYSVATSDLVWSGQSETLNPESLTAVIESMTAAVASKLKNEGLIP